jgi:ABC-2 type transport system permease protein
MLLDRYLPHKTLFWKDWKTSLPVFIPFFLFVTFATTFFLQIEVIGGRGFIGPWPGFVYFENRLHANDPWMGAAMFLLAVALAAVPLGQERERETLGLLLSMPYSRQDILFSKVVVGLMQILITLVLNALLMSLLTWANPEINYVFGLPEIWGWAGHSFLVLTFIFCFTLLIATVSGTTWGNYILALIFLWFPMGFFMLLFINFSIWIDLPDFLDYPKHPFGLLIDSLSNFAELKTIPLWLMAFNELIINQSPTGIATRLVLPYLYGLLAIFSVGLYALAQFLFARNPLEKDGEVLVFERLEGFFKLGVIACFTLLAGPMVASLFARGDEFRLFLIPSYLVAGVGTWYLVNRLLLWRRTK